MTGSAHVSVCLPVYNGAPFVRQAVSSALAQTGVDLELLVIDNASTDSTVDIVRELHDPRLRLLRNETNIGAGRNWSRCLTEARGDLVKILCADDWLYPGRSPVRQRCSTRRATSASCSSLRPATWSTPAADACCGAAGARADASRAGRLRRMARRGTNL